MRQQAFVPVQNKDKAFVPDMDVFQYSRSVQSASFQCLDAGGADKSAGPIQNALCEGAAGVSRAFEPVDAGDLFLVGILSVHVP